MINTKKVLERCLGKNAEYPKCALCGKGITKEEVSYTDGKSYHARCIKWMNNNPTKWSND